MHTVEPCVDVVLVSWEAVLCCLDADVDGSGVVNDVPNMLGHVHCADVAAELPGGRRGRAREEGR